jgi:hypothetical protein
VFLFLLVPVGREKIEEDLSDKIDVRWIDDVT